MTKLPYFAAVCIAIAGCTQAPKIEQSSPAATVGQDLSAAAIMATKDFETVRAGNINYAWAVSEALNTYSTVVKDASDIKELVNAWTDGKGLKLGDRLATLFSASTGTPAQKTAALAAGVQTAALSHL